MLAALALLLLSIGWTAPGYAADSASTVAAPLFFGPWRVAAPAGSDWTLKRQGREGVAWGRSDGAIAYFQAFRLPRVENDRAFVNEVRIFTEKALAGPGKGKLADSSYAMVRARQYPCAKAIVAVDATVANVPTPVRINSRALVCHSSDDPEIGVFIGLSYPAATGTNAASGDSDAQAFIKGAVLTTNAKRRWEK